jgi:hypothetical protein
MTIPLDEGRAWVAANIDTLFLVTGRCTKCNLLTGHSEVNGGTASTVELGGVVPGTNYTVDVLVRHKKGTLFGIEVVDTQYTSYKKMFQCKQAGTIMYEVTTAEIQGAIDAMSKALRTTTTQSAVCSRCTDEEQGVNKKRKTEAAEETSVV